MKFRSELATTLRRVRGILPALGLMSILAGFPFAPIAPANAQGVPVIDGASIKDRALQHAESMAKFLQQIAVLKDQLDNQAAQLAAITGVRNLGNILNNPAIRDALPSDARDILRAANGGGNGFRGILERIEREERLTGNYQVDRQRLDDRARSLALRSQALMVETQNGMTARMKQVGQLQEQINLATDPKAISDLQARLMIEQANIQVDQTRADILARQIEAEQALLDSQSQALADSSFSLEAIRAPLPGRR